MAARDSSSSTPLILWICAAVCAHYMFAEGGGEVAQTYEDHSFIEQLGEAARDRVRQSEQTFEILTGAETKPADPVVPPPDQAQPPPPKPPEKKLDQPKKIEPKKPEEKAKPLIVKVADPTPNVPPPPPQQDRRIAVRQHVKPDQKDNPTAQFVGDQANKVDQETVAQQTSHDEDAENPTPGGNHSGPTPTPGDADNTKIADSSEHAGSKDHAPGEKGTESEAEQKMNKLATAAIQPSQSTAPRGDQHQQSAPMQAEMAPPIGESQPATPEANQATAGNWTFNPIAPGGAAGAAPGQPRPKTAPNQSTTSWLGLGANAAPGQVNINLSQVGLVATVGQDTLRKEREADGERRLSAHRGSWQSSSFEHWRNAIENYVTSVKPGNQTALNTAAVPFATYLNGMHNRIHPIFADSFLGSLDSLPKTHPLNDVKLVTSLEIILTKDGHLQKMGVVKTSGVTAFDVAALDAVNRAQPFGPAPSAIISPDGNVYLHWEFHRDEVFACSTMNARPFLLKGPGAPVGPTPEMPPARPPTNPEQTPAHESREGMYISPVLAGRSQAPKT